MTRPRFYPYNSHPLAGTHDLAGLCDEIGTLAAAVVWQASRDVSLALSRPNPHAEDAADFLREAAPIMALVGVEESTYVERSAPLLAAYERKRGQLLPT